MMKEDVGAEILSMLDDLDIRLNNHLKKVENKVKEISKSKKNSHIHIMINTEEKKKLMDKAEEKGVDFSEWCRRKLHGDSQLDRIEKKINTISNNIFK